MDAYVMNQEFEALMLIENYESIIWVDRYLGIGDFEIFTPVFKDVVSNVVEDNYIQRRGSDRLMIVENVQIISDSEMGDRFKAVGRSLESILDRRIVWKQTSLTGNLQNAVRRLLNENAIAPTDTARAIPNLIFKANSDPRLTSMTVDAQFTGVSLYSAIMNLCGMYDVGFKITLTSNLKMQFELILGKDRSFEQFAEPFVVVSEDFENLLSLDYSLDKSMLRNVALIGGEGEGLNRTYTTIGTTQGLERRELFVDARDISSSVDNVPLTPAEYQAQLKTRGFQKLLEHSVLSETSGEIDPNATFLLNQDFFLGDSIQLVNEYGIEARARVAEILYSSDETGNRVTPTFELL